MVNLTKFGFGAGLLPLIALLMFLSEANADRNDDTPVLDVDASGTVTPLTDGLMILRSMFGFTGDALTDSAVDLTNCQDCDSEEIEKYIADVRGLTFGKINSVDDQNISGSALNGKTLTIGIENGDSESVDLSGLLDGVGVTPDQASAITAITANTAKTGITSDQASAITANTAKTGITSDQASAITANTAKTGITSDQASAITANTAKTGITSDQASAITVNTTKTAEANESVSSLNTKLEAIKNPQKEYSIISSEILESGLVRTKLYAYELSDYSMTARFDESNPQYYIANGLEFVLNALGTFRGQYSYLADYSTTYSDSNVASSPPISCPDGTALQRQSYDVVYNVSYRNESGGFVFSNRGTSNAGIYAGGCASEYYYLEGKGSGEYSCVSRAAYYGAFGGGDGQGWDKVYSPDQSSFPNIVMGVFDRKTNGAWGTYYLEIDAPADCLNLEN
jgi:hypothetical protein